MDAQLTIEPFYGYRAFKVSPPRWRGRQLPFGKMKPLDPTPCALWSLYRPIRWSDSPKTAHCLLGLTHFAPHKAPAEGCTCGIYVADPVSVVEVIMDMARVRMRHGIHPYAVAVAKMRCSGDVIEHERGYRVEVAQIIQLYLLNGLGGYRTSDYNTMATILEDKYGLAVPIISLMDVLTLDGRHVPYYAWYDASDYFDSA